MILKKNMVVSAARVDYAGLGKIKGVTKKLGTNYAKCLIQLLHRNSGVIVDKTRSDASGNYSFSGLKKSTLYFIVAHDPASQYNAVIQDMVIPK